MPYTCVLRVGIHLKRSSHSLIFRSFFAINYSVALINRRNVRREDLAIHPKQCNGTVRRLRPCVIRGRPRCNHMLGKALQGALDPTSIRSQETSLRTGGYHWPVWLYDNKQKHLAFLLGAL
jgi:hypothetical protein